MNHLKPPMPTRDSEDVHADELFDADFLADTDSELFGELDRVLTIESDESEGEALSADVRVSFEPLDLQFDIDSGGQGSTTGSGAAPGETDRVEVEAPPAPKTRDRVRHLSQQGTSEATPQTERAEPEVASAVSARVALAQTGGGTRDGSPATAASIAPGTAEQQYAPVAKAAGNRNGTRRRAPNPGRVSPPSGVSQVWLGVTALLAMVGIGIGVAAIWQQMDTDAHLAWMETRIAAAAAPSRIDREAARDERMQLLEQRLQDEVASLRSSLEQSVERQNERLDQGLAGLQSALLEVHGHLEAVQSQLADAAKRPGGARRQSVKTSAAPVATRSGAARKTGDWVVNLISFRTRKKADKWVARLRDDDIQATVQVADHKGQTWYRLRVDGFGNFAQAKAFAKEIRSEPDLASAWVGRN